MLNCAHNSHKTVANFHFRPTSSGQIYMRLDTHRDGKHTFPIARTWKELANGVDAVFSYSDKIYIIKVGQRLQDVGEDRDFTCNK